MEFKEINPIVLGHNYEIKHEPNGLIGLKLGPLAKYLGGSPNDIELSDYNINWEEYNSLSDEQKEERIGQLRLEYDTEHPDDFELFRKMFPEAYDLAFQTQLAHTIYLCQHQLNLPYFQTSFFNPFGYTLDQIAQVCYHYYVNQYHDYYGENETLMTDRIGIIVYSTYVGHVMVEIVHEPSSEIEPQ